MIYQRIFFKANTAFLEVYLLFLFLVVLGLCCCAQPFSSCASREGAPVWLWLLTVVASLLYFVFSWLRASVLLHVGSGVEVQGLNCLMACGIFLDQGLNPCLLGWQVDS